MKTAQGTVVINNGQLVDGTGRAAIPNAALVIKDGIVAYAGPADAAPQTPPDSRILDAKGGTIMPGLIEAHIHLTYFNVSELQDLDIKYPVEYVTLQSGVNAKTALECGYTAARSGGCLHNIDVWMKKAIEEDMIPGPRLSASGREICGAGGLMDWNPDYRRIGMEGIVFIVNGAEDARTAVRKLVKDGIEWVKTYPTGDAASPDINDHHTLCMTFDEMHAVVATAHNHGLKVTGHCRATEGIRNALKAGYDAVEHGTFMDDECLDLLLKRKVPMCPGLGFELFSVERGKEFGLSQRVLDGHQETLEAGAESCRKVLKAGGTMGLGGDYGFAWTPHGTYAQELTFFVNYVGFTPMETIQCATLGGAKIMGRESEIGSLEKGKLADVLVVDGDVLKDISILEDRANLIAVMQGGVVKAGRILQPAGLSQKDDSLLSAVLRLLVFFVCIAGHVRAATPNILLILADDMGYGDVSCNNPQSLIPTPHVDQLAAAGRRFTEAHAPASVCSPTRYGLLTGRYAWRTAMKEGVLYDYDPALIKKGRMTVASLLKDAGYHTGAFGKWHVGVDWTPKPGDAGDWQWGTMVRYYSPHTWSRLDATKPVRNGPIDLGFDTFYGGVSQGVSRRYIEGRKLTKDVIARDEIDNVFAERAEKFLREHAAAQKEKPFFVYLALGAVHGPHTPPANLAGKSKTGALGDMCLWADQTVGRMTALLEELGLAQDTLVIFTSDNGSIHFAPNDKLGHRPSGDRRGYKTDIWDGGTHVPFIARWPGRIKEGTSSGELICLVDLMATFAAITGRQLPAWQAEDSFNILPALTGEGPGRKELITHSYTGVFAIRQEGWKLILGTKGSGGHQSVTPGWDGVRGGYDRTGKIDIGQLYHLKQDAGETKDLWDEKPEIVARLRDLMDVQQSHGFTRDMGIVEPSPPSKK